MESFDPSKEEIGKFGLVNKFKTLFEKTKHKTQTENAADTTARNSMIDSKTADVIEVTQNPTDVVSNGYVSEKQDENLSESVDQLQSYDKSLLDEISQLNAKIGNLEALLAEKNQETDVTLQEFTMYKIKIMKTLEEFGNVVANLTQENKDVKKALAEKMQQNV